VSALHAHVEVLYAGVEEAFVEELNGEDKTETDERTIEVLVDFVEVGDLLLYVVDEAVVGVVVVSLDLVDACLGGVDGDAGNEGDE
jgi:hypothetical protein